MTILHKRNLMTYHAFSRLRLMQATIVNVFECHVKNRMPVNRLLFVFSDNHTNSSIRDINNNNLIPMQSGCLYFIPCNYLIDINIAPGLSFVSLQFNLDLFYGFDVFENHPKCEIIKDVDLVTELKTLMKNETELSTLYRINEIIFHLCFIWSQIDSPDLDEKIVHSHKYDKILTFIQKSCDATTTVEMLADMNGMRKDVFSRKFSKDMGFSPKKFISDIIVRKATEMLLVPSILVREVAGKLNFSSEYYFSHFFKRHIGMSPKAYQKQTRDI